MLYLNAILALAAPAPIAEQPVIDFSLHSSSVAPHATLPYEVTTETYYSNAIKLKAGHMIFTKPADTPLKMPSGDIAMVGFFGDIVNEKHEPVPLSKVYDHHWIAVNSVHRNEICSDSLNYVFGIGAESRNNPINLPDGYGYVVNNDKVMWGANIHLLRTEGLSGDNQLKAAKECNECYYGPDKGEQCTKAQNGTFLCCGERDYMGVASCPTHDAPLPAEETFYLRYRVNYTRSVDAITPVQVSIATAPDCATFYEAIRNDDQPEHLAQYEFVTPVDVEVLFAAGHQHTGSLNISLFVNDELKCTSFPRYGTQKDVPGDELGYLVQMSTCVNETSGPLKWKRGDKIRIDSWYYVGSHDARLQYSDGTHLNVMGYMYMHYTRGGKEESVRLETSRTPLLDSSGKRTLNGMAMAEAPMAESMVRGTRVWKHVPLPELQPEQRIVEA